MNNKKDVNNSRVSLRWDDSESARVHENIRGRLCTAEIAQLVPIFSIGHSSNGGKGSPVRQPKTMKNMEISRINDGKGGSYIISELPEIKKVNPIEYYRKAFIASNFFMSSELIRRLNGLPFASNLIDKICSRKAHEVWDEYYNSTLQVKIPENLKKLFDTTKKREQVKLLKGLTLTHEILLAFIFYAWKEKGYSFSQIKSEHLPKGIKKDELPTIINVKDTDIETVGDSPMTKGQQKQVIENRKVVIAKILDKGDEWHCFFVTYDSLKGKESWKDGQPHFHYISDKFGINRGELIKKLKNKRYNLGSLPHIDFNE